MSTTCPEWLPTHLYPFTHRHVEVDGTQVHYVDEGEGRPLLFVHGNPDYSFLFRQQIQALQSDYRCLAVDLPGFGLSIAGQGYGFTPAEHATVVARFAAQLDVSEAVLVVHDWGGPIGLDAAATAPERYRGLILAGTLAWPDYRHQQPFWARWMMGYVASERGRRAAIERNLLVEGPVDWEMRKGSSPPDDAVKAAYRGPFATPESRLPPWILAHHLWSDAGEGFLGTVQERTRRLAHLPALMIFGGRDRYTSARRELPRLQQLFPQNEAVVIRGAGHFFPESAGDAMSAAMQDWLARIDT